MSQDTSNLSLQLDQPLENVLMQRRISKYQVHPLTLSSIARKLSKSCQIEMKCSLNSVSAVFISPAFAHLISDHISFEIWDAINRGINSYRWKNLKEIAFFGSKVCDSSKTFSKLTQTQSCKNLSGLQQFKFIFCQTSSLTDSMLGVTAENIARNFSNLRSLALSFSLEKITTEGFKVFGFELCHSLLYLNSLTLKLEESDIQDEGINSLALQIGRWLPKLKRLCLHFAQFNQITNAAFQSLGHLVGNKLAHLESFDFSIDSCQNVSEGALEEFLRSINNPLPNLIEFSLNFQAITTHDSKLLGTCLVNNFVNLKSLSIDLSPSELTTPESLRVFGMVAAGRLTELKQFSLVLYSARKSDDFLEIISTHLLNSLSNLKRLALSFPHCESVTDKGLEAFGSFAIPKLVNLVSLSVKFSSIKEISDKGLNEIGQNIAIYLTKLQELSLQFQHCPKITGNGLESICLKNLNKLELNFVGCEGILDEGLEELASKFLTESENLQTLTLIFATCHKITDRGYEAVASKIAIHLTKLEALYMDFGINLDITRECKERVRNSLNRISTLKIR